MGEHGVFCMVNEKLWEAPLPKIGGEHPRINRLTMWHNLCRIHFWVHGILFPILLKQHKVTDEHMDAVGQDFGHTAK